MKSGINILKKAYDLIGNDYLRAFSLRTLETFGVRKDILRLDTNDLCNLRCIMCGTHSRKGKSDHFMSLEDFHRVMDLFADTTRLLYMGCAFEPLVTQSFEEFAIHAKSRGIPFISFPTNGILLNEGISKVLVDHRIDEIIISWNGYTRDDYNRIMHPASFDKLLDNLDFLTEYKARKNSDLPKIRINTIFMKSNIEKFNDLLELIGRYKVEGVQFRELLFTNDMNDPEEVKKELVTNIDGNELDSIMKEIRSHAIEFAREGKEIILPRMLMEKEEVESKKSVTKKAHCSIPYFSLWVEHNGIVKSCIFDHDAVLGNIFQDSIETIRQNQKRYRNKALNGKCRNETCLMNVDSSTVL